LEDIRCADCKRLARIQPYIGERYVFKRIKWDAKKAGRPFNLSFEWFKEVIQKPCHYCNRSRVNKVSVASKKPGEFLLVDFRYNGLDRVDNTLGYEEDNCVPCCVVCNRAKNSMPYDEFMDYVQSLVNYQNSIGDSNVIDDHALHSERISYRGRHRKAGEHSVPEEPQEDLVPVSNVGLTGADLYRRNRWSRGIYGGPYREVEGTV
jgi:hypothetical protein